MLDETDHRLDETSNGKDAVERFKVHPYDLVLMDIQMPVMDGCTAAREIRVWEKTQDRKAVPIVSVTAHASAEVINRCFEAGCTAHLRKPLRRKALLEMIAEMTGRLEHENGDQTQVIVEANMRRMIPKFMNDMTKSCRSIQAAAEAKNMEEIAQHCHRVKGTGGVFGFHELSRLAGLLEIAALSGDHAESSRLSTQLSRHLANAKIKYE